MELIDFFIAGIVILGIFTSYTDLRYGKIRNSAIVFAFVYGIAAIGGIYLFKGFEINANYIIQTLSNLVIALLIGFFVWLIKGWTAGDGKLFTAYAFLIPVFNYAPHSYIPYFPGLNIMINTFVPLFMVLSIVGIFKAGVKDVSERLKIIFSPKSLFAVLILVFSGSWLMGIMLSYLPQELILLEYIASLIFFYAVYDTMESKTSKKEIKLAIYVLLVLLLVLRMIFDKNVFSADSLASLALWGGFFMLIRFMVMNAQLITEVKKVRIGSLRPGMVPAEVIYEENSKPIKKVNHFSLLNAYMMMQGRYGVGSSVSEGLSKEDIKNFRSLAKKHPGLKTIKIEQTVPFAPFLLGGVLLTLLSQGNVFIYVKFLIANFLY